jgi:hypothetical protein
MKRLGLALSLMCVGALLMSAAGLGGCTDLTAGSETTAATTAAATTTIASLDQGSSTTDTAGGGGVTATTKKQVTATTGGSTTSVSYMTYVTMGLHALHTTTTPQGFTRYEDGDHRLVWSGPWHQVSNGSASAGAYMMSVYYASVKLRFEGTRIDFVAATENCNGIAKLTLDGTEYTADLYSQDFASKVVWTSPDLPYGVHTLLIEQTTLDGPSPNLSKYIQFDAVDIWGKLVSP